ncbi:Clr5 domain-containing protein [Exophiala viscosa]|uniref:Clr5 domain-containing protein n=1 Tax=Exophiala viscosa TaxID=2486360 RepID=A0AAN6ICI1_9EURO|nr:Clr5 domain-containing protein [Exophiala viscosa]
MSSAPRAPVIPKVEWNRLREPIERRYMGEKMSLQDLMEDMKRQYQFHATDKQYKRQLAQWGIRKNIPAEAMEVILNGSCNKARIVEIQSRYTVTNRKIQRFRHRQGQKIAPHGTITSDSASTSWEASTRNNPRIENITETSSNDNHIWHADEISDVQLSLPLDRERLMFVRIMKRMVYRTTYPATYPDFFSFVRHASKDESYDDYMMSFDRKWGPRFPRIVLVVIYLSRMRGSAPYGDLTPPTAVLLVMKLSCSSLWQTDQASYNYAAETGSALLPDLEQDLVIVEQQLRANPFLTSRTTKVTRKEFDETLTQVKQAIQMMLDTELRGLVLEGG